MNLNIVFENHDLIIVDKPSGLQVEPDKNNHPNLLNILQNKPGLNQENHKLFVVNRIDRPTSGLVIFAKKKSVCTFLQSLWANNEVQKKYYAVVQGSPSESHSTLSHYIYKDFKQHKAIVSTQQVDDNYKECKLNYKKLNSNSRYSLLEILLLTGRYHQIRAQMSFIGHPIWNDVLYGAEKVIDESIIGLHCFSNTLKISASGNPATFQSFPEEHQAFIQFLDFIPHNSKVK